MYCQSNGCRKPNYWLVIVLLLGLFLSVKQPSNVAAEVGKITKRTSRRTVLPELKGLPAPLASMLMMQTPTTYSCLPTCVENDARMLVLAGTGLETLVAQPIMLTLLSKANSPTLEIGIFDPESAGKWDAASLNLKFELILDPAGDGAGTEVLHTWRSTDFPTFDNQWLSITVDNDPRAQISVFHSYLFKITVDGVPGSNVYNGFKIRTDGRVGSLSPQAALFSLLAPYDENVRDIIYPRGLFGASGLPDVRDSTYDGFWTFNLVVPSGATRVEIWDGDFDVAGTISTYNPATNQLEAKSDAVADQDTNDPDTPPSFACDDGLGGTVIKVSPCFAADSESVAERAAGYGNPRDDNGLATFRRTLLSTDPSVPLGEKYLYGTRGLRYRLISPSGVVFENANPSGTREWEQFLITSEPGFVAGSTADFVVPTVESGIWRLEIDGLDLSNLVALRLTNQVLPGTLDIGDFVWNDLNGDGVQDPGEPGIANVDVELLDSTGVKIAETTTNIGGNYFFEVEAGTYTTRVAASNFDPGGALGIYTPTVNYDGIPGGDNQRTQAVSSDLFTFDYGYNTPGGGGAGTGAIGNQVFRDSNGNGTFDPGESGIPGVTVKLTLPDATEQSLVTNASGQYQFTGLGPGNYQVSVVSSTLPAGLAKTTGLNPGADNNSQVIPYAITLADGEDNPTADFGYINSTDLCLPGEETNPGSGGTLITEILPSGDLFVRFLQPRTINDNAYGTSALSVGWGNANKAKFSRLVNSDFMRIQFRDTSGNVVLEFRQDYVSLSTPTASQPSGYMSLGATGGNGGLTTGNAAWILRADSSIAQDLNRYCSSPTTCVVAGVDLYTNSPPTNSNYVPFNPIFNDWEFTNYYEVVISKAAFGGNVAANFGSITIPHVNNSPPKTGGDHLTPTPCTPDNSAGARKQGKK